MSHYTDRTHFFRDENDNRQVVVTTMVDKGDYTAVMIEGLPDDAPELEGRGDTRMAAIADLVRNIKTAELEL